MSDSGNSGQNCIVNIKTKETTNKVTRYAELKPSTSLGLQEYLEDMAVEQYDAVHKYSGDVIDKATGLKKSGVFDHEKLGHWQRTLEKSLQRRLIRKRENQADKQYREEHNNNSKLSSDASLISRQSHEFFDCMRKGDDYYN